MKTINYLLSGLLFLLSIGSLGQENKPTDINPWTGSTDQKISGLMTVWSEIKFGFPYPEKLAAINWDQKIKESIPKVIESKSMEDYYYILMELVAQLHDSHTSITPPWGPFKPGFDMPPIEIAVIDDRFIVQRVGQSPEIKSKKIYPGLEIVSIDDGIPIQKHFQENILRYYSQTTSQADNALLVAYLLLGPKGEKLQLKVRDIDGSERDIELSRTSICENGEPFMYNFLFNLFVANTIDQKMIDDQVLYVNIPNFSHDQISSDFIQLIEDLDTTKVKGMIIDLRGNMGGNNKICNKIVESLIDRKVESPVMHFPHYIAAYKAWGKAPIWSESSYSISPREGNKFLGPVVVLVSPVTGSTAEDFVIELKATHRITLFGEKTSGGGGNELHHQLPGGGDFTLSTFKSTYPDGTEYIGIGILPDHEIHPTVNDIYTERDIVLEEGYKYLLNCLTSHNGD